MELLSVRTFTHHSCFLTLIFRTSSLRTIQVCVARSRTPAYYVATKYFPPDNMHSILPYWSFCAILVLHQYSFTVMVVPLAGLWLNSTASSDTSLTLHVSVWAFISMTLTLFLGLKHAKMCQRIFQCVSILVRVPQHGVTPCICTRMHNLQSQDI